MTYLPYNEKDIFSIFDYSKRLVHKCLRDFAPDANEYGGKGSLGQLVEELFFGYDINTRQEADFSLAGVELKCTPLKLSAEHILLVKERLVCSMINYQTDWDKTFEESHFYQKCLIMLIMFYLHNPKVSKLDLQFLFAVLWKIPEKDLLIIRNDYNTIISKIKNGQAHTLSEGDTMYLGACRKGQKGDSLMQQHNSETGAPRRAWCLECEEWTGSRLYELFTSRFLFVVFRQTGNTCQVSRGKPEPEYRLEKVAFWTMPQADLAIARQYWTDIRQNVLANHISPQYFWSVADDRNFHVRPKARQASDMAENPNGGMVQKYCYWFNRNYVRNIIEHEI